MKTCNFCGIYFSSPDGRNWCTRACMKTPGIYFYTGIFPNTQVNFSTKDLLNRVNCCSVCDKPFQHNYNRDACGGGSYKRCGLYTRELNEDIRTRIPRLHRKTSKTTLEALDERRKKKRNKIKYSRRHIPHMEGGRRIDFNM